MNGTVIFPFQQRPVFPGIRPGNGQIEIFSRPQVMENSRQYLPLRIDILQKTVVGCPRYSKIIHLAQFVKCSKCRRRTYFFCRTVSIVSDSNLISKRKREIRCRLFTHPIKREITKTQNWGEDARIATELFSFC